MNTNILKAILNLQKTKDNNIVDIYKSNIRINSVGDALEYYIKDLFCGTLDKKIAEKEACYASNFSYLGNLNNPPDFIIRGSDAVEVKKIGGLGSSIALNSSFPKSKLLIDDSFITDACRNCEEWKEKDYIYTIGSVINKKLRLLWMVYGDCYAADKEVYERTRKAIKDRIKTIKGVQLSETKELGKVKKVDPLGITVLRIRGMWHIEHPRKAFDYVVDYNDRWSFSLFAIIRSSKYNSFPTSDRKQFEAKVGAELSLSDIKIKNPDNPAQYIDAKLIKLFF